MIDIIIPIYNTPIKDLERCLTSILNQNYREWRTILVDDGSKEDIGKWLDLKYGIDNRFNIIHTTNGGVSKARNLGLEHSSNEYVVFCDSDDSLRPDFLSQAIFLMKQHNLDFVVGSIQMIEGTNKKVFGCEKNVNNLWLYENEEIKNVIDYMLASIRKKDNLELGTLGLGFIGARMYKREKIKMISFNNEVHMSEDLLFNLEYLFQCEKIGITPEIWYEYYKNSYSATHKDKNIIMGQQIRFANVINTYRIQCQKKNLEDALNFCILWRMYYCLYTVCLEKKKNKSRLISRIIQMEIFKETVNVDAKEYIGIGKGKKIFVMLVKSKPLKLKVVSLQFYFFLHRILPKIKHFIRDRNLKS